MVKGRADTQLVGTVDTEGQLHQETPWNTASKSVGDPSLLYKLLERTGFRIDDVGGYAPGRRCTCLLMRNRAGCAIKQSSPHEEVLDRHETAGAIGG